MSNKVVSSNATINTSNSQIVGSNNDIKGDNNSIVGSNNDIKGNNNNIKGSNNDVKGNNNIMVGSNCSAKGYNNQVTGSNSTNKEPKNPKTVLTEMNNYIEGNNSTGSAYLNLVESMMVQRERRCEKEAREAFKGVYELEKLVKEQYPFKPKWNTGIINLNEDGHRELEEFMKQYEEC